MRTAASPQRQKARQKQPSSKGCSAPQKFPLEDLHDEPGSGLPMAPLPLLVRTSGPAYRTATSSRMNPPLKTAAGPNHAERRARFLEAAQKLDWFTQINVEDGLIMEASHDAHGIMVAMGMPEDLSGLTVLDIGAADGYMSFECERRGALRVVALDMLVRPTLNLLHEYLDSKVEIFAGSVYTLDPNQLGTFDIVIFSGVLYHCRYPALAVDRVRTVTRGTCYVETYVSKIVMPGQPDIGAALFFEENELSGDFTNWTGANPPQVLRWFRSAGFDVTLLGVQGVRAFLRAEAIPVKPPYLTCLEYPGMNLEPVISENAGNSGDSPRDVALRFGWKILTETADGTVFARGRRHPRRWADDLDLAYMIEAGERSGKGPVVRQLSSSIAVGNQADTPIIAAANAGYRILRKVPLQGLGTDVVCVDALGRIMEVVMTSSGPWASFIGWEGD